jgi:hypothetical protein
VWKLGNGYGPFDYRKTDAARRSIVEKFHFTSKVETLRGGSTASTPGGDLAYTLRAFPNHPRALMATIRFAEQTKRNPPEMIYSVSCWLERAEAFQPDDTTVKMLFGSYLVRSGKPKEGIQKLEASLELSGDDTNVLTTWGSPISNSKTLIGPLNLHTARMRRASSPWITQQIKKLESGKKFHKTEDRPKKP